MTRNELIERLERGEVGREIDSLVARMFGASVRWSFITYEQQRRQVYWEGDPIPDDNDALPDLPTYTTSLDAAVALCERVRPDLTWHVRNDPISASLSERKGDGNGFWQSVAPYATPAAALLAALLKATGGG